MGFTIMWELNVQKMNSVFLHIGIYNHSEMNCIFEKPKQQIGYFKLGNMPNFFSLIAASNCASAPYVNDAALSWFKYCCTAMPRVETHWVCPGERLHKLRVCRCQLILYQEKQHN